MIPCNGFENSIIREKGVKSRNFTERARFNYEPARSLVGEEVDYVFNYRRIKELEASMANAYLDILFLDTVCFNMDRHTENYGFLRDPHTGAFLKMAPNFDNNIALISKGYPSDIKRRNDLFIHDFLDLLEAIDEKYAIPELNEKMILQAMSEVPIKVDAAYVVDFILGGYGQLKDH